MHLSRAETHICSGHNDKKIKVWNAKTREKLFQLDDAHSEPVSAVRFTPDERYIASASKDDSIKIWDIRQRKLLHSFENAQFRIGSYRTKLCVSNNSQYVICGTKDGHVVFYDLKLGACEDIIKNKHNASIVACEWF